MAKYNVNTTGTADEQLDNETQRRLKTRQEKEYEAFLRQNNSLSGSERTSQKEMEKEVANKLSDLTPGSQANVLPLQPGEESNFNPGMRTQMQNNLEGAATLNDGTVINLANLSMGEMELMKAQRGAEVNSPLNELGANAAEFFDVRGAADNVVPGLNQFGFENNANEMSFNRGVNRQLENNFDPSAEKNNLVEMLSTAQGPKLQSYANNIEQANARQDLDPVTIKNKLTTIQKGTERFKRAFDKLLAQNNIAKSPADMAAIEQMLFRNNVSSRTLTELMYNKIAPAAQVMENNSPNGLAGAMYLAGLQHYADAKIATDKRIELLDRYPRDQKDLNSWTKDDREAFQNLSTELYNEEMAGQKSIGYLVAQAGNMKLTGPEMAILSEVTKKVLVDEFGAEMFSKMNTVLGEKVMLTESQTNWVNEDKNMMMYLLNQPIKLPRVGEAGRIPLEYGKLDVRMKGIANQLTPWLKGQDFDSETNADMHKLAVHVLNDTPHTTLNAQSRGHAMMMGFNSQTGEFNNNALTSLYDNKAFKNIKYEGESGNRNKDVEKYDMATNEMKPIRDFSDTEKDNLAQLNLKSAVGYINKQIRFNHFVGSNFRFYHEASVLSPADHSARAFLGAGAYIPFKINSGKDMMKLKAGIMTMADQKVPGSQVKYEQTRFKTREEAFDSNIVGWMNNYADLVEAFNMLDNPNIPIAHEMEMIRQFQDINSPLAQAAKKLLEFGQEHNGYYSTNAVIEGVKLQLAIENGKTEFMSNYMFEVDGTSNGLAINALAIAEMNILAMTGITDFIIDQETGYNYPSQYDEKGNIVTDTSSLNILTAPKPYEMLTQTSVAMLEAASAPAKRILLGVGIDSGLIGDKNSKGQITKGSYGSGQETLEKTIAELYNEIILNEPSYEQELFDGGYSTKQEIVKDLAKISWRGLTKITGELRKYGSTQQQFMTQIVEQYTASKQPDGTYSLPPPTTTLDGGFLLRHGEKMRTIHGPQLALPAGLPGSDTQVFRQMTNMIDPEGRKRDKATGQPVQYLAAVTGAPVKMTHHVDAYMVLNVAIRSHQENPGAAHGVVGGITMQMYDGFFGSPMYADWMDKTLNEEFLNLGYKINNVSALIDSAEAQGYDLTTKKMKPIITRLLGFQAKGRKMLSDLPKQGITGNQFQINGGATINSTQLNEDKTIKEFGYLESQRFEATNIKAKHVSSKSKPIGRRLYSRPNGANEAEVERRIISEAEKKESIKNQLEKTSQVKRVGNYDSKLAKFNVNDKVVFYNTDNTAQLNGAIVQLAAANSVEEGINYVVRADSGKQYMVPQNKISKA